MGSTESNCQHYQRKCFMVSPCCNKEYGCRICHDENEEHTLNRREVQQIVCLQCKTKQKVQRNCEECGILFGRYTCLTCRLFDDVDKKQFHCDGCGICRVGGSENFYHCDICNMCIGIGIKDSHKCLADSSKQNCPVCLEYLHTSRKVLHIPQCSHVLHYECYRSMLQHGKINCPICNRSLEDMSGYWALLDKEISETPMPLIYQNYKVNVLCRDCREESLTDFHVVGLKCLKCGGYNTTRIGGDEPLPEDPLETLQETVRAINLRHQNEEGGAGEDDEFDEGSWETVTDEEEEAGESEESENEADGGNNESESMRTENETSEMEHDNNGGGCDNTDNVADEEAHTNNTEPDGNNHQMNS